MNKWRAKCRNLKTLLTKKRRNALDKKFRQREFETWKVEQKAFLLQDESNKLTNDEIVGEDFDTPVIQDFLKRNLYLVGDSRSKKELEDMLGFYVEKLCKRENSIQNSYSAVGHFSKDIEAVEAERAILEDKLFQQDHDYHQTKHELKAVVVKEKARLKLMEDT